MQKTESTRSAARMTDAAVQAKTGKTWPEWFAVLDAAKAASMSHQQIVALLSEKHGVPDWWTQMVTNTYEQHIGRRERYQMPGGYQVSVSRTLAVSLSSLYQAWQQEGVRGRWLGEAGLSVRKATPDKSLRMTWADGTTSVEALFYARGAGRSQVTVEHGKLGSADEAQRMKDYWREALGRLEGLLSAQTASSQAS